jgi:prepilin-type N-terminal cleavage/methylation domain-containing protein
VRKPVGPATTSGFTLVEIMVVLIILGLVGGIAVSSWTSMLPRQQFNSAIRNLSEVLYETRSQAISRNREFRIRYDLDEETYAVRTPFRPGGGTVGRELADTERDSDHIWTHETNLTEGGIDLKEIRIDDRVYTDGKVEVYFQPLGASSHHTIELTQPLFDLTYTLEVLPLTGEIRMHEGSYKRDPVDEGDFR